MSEGRVPGSPLSAFFYYVGEGAHYLQDDFRRVLVTLFGEGKRPEQVVVPVSPAEMLARIESLQSSLQDRQSESSDLELQLDELKRMVERSQQQQQRLARELSDLSGVLRSQ